MVRIDRITNSSSVKRKQGAKKSSSAGTDFAKALQGSGQAKAPKPLSTGFGQPFVPVFEKPNQDQQNSKEGFDLLDQLEKLRIDLLMGKIPSSRLETLTQRLKVFDAYATSPQHKEVLEEIKLRVGVELAKLGKI